VRQLHQSGWQEYAHNNQTLKASTRQANTQRKHTTIKHYTSKQGKCRQQAAQQFRWKAGRRIGEQQCHGTEQHSDEAGKQAGRPTAVLAGRAAQQLG
jgi:hypothetical protein